MNLATPAGFTTRPLTPDDAGAVFELMAAEELAALGRVEIERADIVADWARPSFSVSEQTVGVFDGAALVGYAEHGGDDRSDAGVLPSYHGRGLGTWLAGWVRERARAAGAGQVGMAVPQGSPGDRLLAALGYDVRWTSWVLQLPAGAEIAARPLPEGYDVRQADEADYRALHTVIAEAFGEWAVHSRQDFDDFRAAAITRPGFAPWNLRVLTAPDGEIVGAAWVLNSEGSPPEAYIPQLAVRRDHRRRGLAQALMADAYAAAREHGAVRFGLSTDSRTGALDLYLKVGMEVTDVWVNRGIRLG